MTSTSNQPARRTPRLFALSIDRFNAVFSSDLISMPQDVAAIGWLPERNAWCCAPKTVVDDSTFRERAPSTLQFLSDRVLPIHHDGKFWTLYCAYDGWRGDRA